MAEGRKFISGQAADNGHWYQFYLLQKVGNAYDLGISSRTRAKSTAPTGEQLRKEKTIERRLTKEGMDKNMILD